MSAEQTNLVSGLRGFWPVLAGHLGHARLADRVFYRLRRSSPTWLAQNDPEIRVLTKYPGYMRPPVRFLFALSLCAGVLAFEASAKDVVKIVFIGLC